MKKIIILAGALILAVGATSFGRDFSHNGMMSRTGYHHNSQHYTEGWGGHSGHSGHNCGGRSYTQNKDVERNRIIISEKRVELRKEMLKDNPDWTKIEKLNQDIAIKNAENRSIVMRERANYNNNY